MYLISYLFLLYIIISTILVLHLTDANCSKPPELDDAYVRASDDKDSYNVGDVVNYICDIGLRKDLSKGRGVATCKQNGEWTEPDIGCLPIQCPHLDNPQYGRIVGTEVTHGKIVTFECNSGYYRWTKNKIYERVCNEDGTWNSEEFECRPNECPDLSDIANGKLSQKTGVYKDKVTYSCLPSFVMKGNAVRECLEDKTWSFTEPQCVSDLRAESCPSPFSKDFKDSHKHLAQTDIPLGIKPGHTVTFICKSDANLKVNSVCSDFGEWTPPPPTDAFCSVQTTLISSTATVPTSTVMTTQIDVTFVDTTTTVKTSQVTEVTVISTQGKEEETTTTTTSTTQAPSGKDESGKDTDVTENPEEEKSFPTWIIVLISLLGTGIIVTILALVLRKKLKHNGSLKEKTDVDMESLSNDTAHVFIKKKSNLNNAGNDSLRKQAAEKESLTSH